MIGIVLGTMLLGLPVGPPAVEVTDTGRVKLELPGDLIGHDPGREWRIDAPRHGQSTTAKQSSTAVKVLGVALGALGGFYAGGMVGFYTAQDRNANDDGVSGLRGVVIGAPIGAVVGGLIGFQIAK